MANEHTLIFETTTPIPFTCADATLIERGALLKMTDPMTAIIVSAAVDSIAGVAAEEKIANDGHTKISVYRGGIFKATLSGSCVVGDALVNDVVPNMVKTATGLTEYQLSGSKILGIALETGATGESILYELRPMSQGGV
jgi:hypothetical protein